MAEVRVSPEARRGIIEGSRTTISHITSSTEVKPWRPLAKKLTGEKAVALWDASKQLAQQDAFRESGMVELHRSAAKAIKKAPEKVKAELGYEISMEIIANLNAAENGDAQAVDRIKADVQAADFLGVESGIPNMRVLLSTARQVYEVPKVVQEGKRISRRAAIGLGALATTAVAGAAGGLYMGIPIGEAMIKQAGIRRDLAGPPPPEPAKTPVPEPDTQETPGPALAPSPVAEVKSPEVKPPTVETKAIKGGLFKDILGLSLYTYIEERRRALSGDRERQKRIDQEINRGRVNFLFLATGTEDWQMDAPLIDLIMPVSWGIPGNEAVLANFLRDLHAPNIDRFKKAHGMTPDEFNAINTAYWASRDAYRNNPEELKAKKFDLTKEIVEQATGLSADLAVKTTIPGFINFIGNTFGNVEVDIREDIYNPAKKTNFPRGKQKLTPKELLMYASSRVNTKSGDERNSRMQELVDIFFQHALKEWDGGTLSRINLVRKVASSLSTEIDNGNIECDFDMKELVVGQLTQVAAALATGSDIQFDKPAMSRLILDNGVIYEERARGKRDDLVTIGDGDYKAPDLQNGYWKRFRNIVRSRILSKSSSTH